MCGITGFRLANGPQEHPVEILERMSATLAHRGPDDSGTWYDGAAAVGLAFRRLAIIDLSPEGHQPMHSASGRYTIVFNGEIYNFEELRSELGGGTWRGRSDTEVMLAAIERWGLNPALQRFVGMFAFALWDSHEHRLCLVRDRLGIKPLYYGRAGGNFVFASELKAIRSFPGFDGVIDRDTLAAYIRCAYVPAPYSIYRGIHQVPPGSVVTLHSGADAVSVSSFWSLEEAARTGKASPAEGSDAELMEQLHQKLRDAIRLRMIADVPLGAFLSGGIDSSLVVALMQAQSSRPVKTFTIGFAEESHNEAAYARTVAEHLGTDHTEFVLSAQDVLNVVPLLPSMYDEPFADSSQIPTHLVAKMARRHVTAALSGDGGDELFCGYSRYSFAHSLQRVLARVPQPIANAGAKLIRSVSPASIDRCLELLPARGILKNSPGQKFHRMASHLANPNAAEIYLSFISMWADPSAVVPGSQEHDAVLAAIHRFGWLSDIRDMAMLSDAATYLPDDLLTKLDRASMAVSLEARVPILDHRVVEFALRLPLRLKTRDRQTKWALRQILYRYVPPQIVERPKMGFSVPMDSWLRGPLREWAEDLLSSENLNRHGLFAVQPIREKWQEHLSAHRNWQHLLWPVLMFQAWISQAATPSHHSVETATGSGARQP